MNTEFTIKKAGFTRLFQGDMKEMLQLFCITKNL